MHNHSFVFVTGLHRSGTSPLHRCLRQHTQISGFTDTNVPEDEGQHLQTVLPRGGAYGGPGRFGRHPEAHWTEEHPLATPVTAKALFQQWSPYWDLSRPYLVEKTPITLLRTRFFQALFPNSYFVVVVRHPAAVALATYNACVINGVADGLTIADLIDHWVLCHEIFLNDLPYLRRKIVLTYEEFAAHPQTTLDTIFAFLGLPPHTNGEEINPNVNARYLDQWRTMQHDPGQQVLLGNPMSLEPRVRQLGYSLEDWSYSRPLTENA